MKDIDDLVELTAENLLDFPEIPQEMIQAMLEHIKDKPLNTHIWYSRGSERIFASDRKPEDFDKVRWMVFEKPRGADFKESLDRASKEFVAKP